MKNARRSTMSRRGRWVAGLGLLLATSLLAACGDTSDNDNSASRVTEWNLPNGDLQNTRNVGGPINPSNVSTLGVAWTVPITATGGFGGFSSTPVVEDGVMYAQDLDSNVQAIDLAAGTVLWTHKYDSTSVGPNGLSVVDGTVFGATGDSAFALEASSGEQMWIKKLTRNGNEGIDMPPGVNDGTVYVSTVPGNTKKFYAGSGQAVLWAMDASTGATKWKWDEVPADLWSAKHTRLNSGGGQWYPPAFDEQGNLYVGVSNPAPFPGAPGFPWGSSRPGPNLYTDSIVKLDEQTGKVMWHYQLTPHDIYDWDLENSPILSDANGRQIVIDGGKAGILVAVDAETGKPMWKTKVGIHNGHDNDNIAALHGDFSKLNAPETIEPGDLGGIESQLASDGDTVFAAANNLPSHYASDDGGLASVQFADPSTGTGNLVAVDEATGKVKWDRKLPSSPYGGATLTNGVVFTTTFDGTLYAFNSDTGDEIWHTSLNAGTNAPVAVFGDTLVTAGTIAGKGQKAQIIAYRLGATGTVASTTSSSSSTTTTTPSTTTTTTPSTTTTTSTTTTSTASPASSASTGSDVRLDATGDKLAYNADQETANAGEVTVDFTNNSALDHDVVLIDSQNKILGKTPVFEGGTKGFKAKLSAGTYTYYCSVPGHRQAGMQGTLTVK